MEAMVENLVRERIEQMDIEYLVRESVRGLIAEQAKAAIKPLLDKELSAIIVKEIEGIFTTEVKTDDGWGKKATYPTFEDFFKAEFSRKLNEQYQIKSVLEKLVKERVQSLIQQDYAKVVETIVDTLTASKLVKKS